MSQPFAFKQFTIKQTANPQKVGADSMLLGAWIAGNFETILDIGTGTGILALMLAQKNPNARIEAIEPDLPSLTEAVENFSQSPFKHQITAVHTPLQTFNSVKKFDLIVCNPPYFENAYLSADTDRNRARHTTTLAIKELYQHSANLMTTKGVLALIMPYDSEKEHINHANAVQLYPSKILRTRREDGTFKRSLILFSFDVKTPKEEEICVKNKANKYTEAYIELTRDFYLHDLRLKGKM